MGIKILALTGSERSGTLRAVVWRRVPRPRNAQDQAPQRAQRAAVACIRKFDAISPKGSQPIQDRERSTLEGQPVDLAHRDLLSEVD